MSLEHHSMSTIAHNFHNSDPLAANSFVFGAKARGCNPFVVGKRVSKHSTCCSEASDINLKEARAELLATSSETDVSLREQ